MFGSLFKSAFKHLGLGKQAQGISGLLSKARNVVGTGLNLLRSAPVKNIVKSISEYVPSAGQYYNDAKKYGAIASNLLSGGADKKWDRFKKKEAEAPTIERVPRLKFRRPGMFEDPEALPDL